MMFIGLNLFIVDDAVVSLSSVSVAELNTTRTKSCKVLNPARPRTFTVSSFLLLLLLIKLLKAYSSNVHTRTAAWVGQKK